jgi:opacity protein-like surface antigen
MDTFWNRTVTGTESVTSTNNLTLLYDPKATLRIGYGCCGYLLYAGGGMGISMLMSDPKDLFSKSIHTSLPNKKDDITKKDWVPTWHIRLGVDLRLKGNWFAGMFYEYQRSFVTPHNGSGHDSSQNMTLVTDRISFVFGYQF